MSVAVVCLLVTRDYTRVDASAAASDLGCFAVPFVARLGEEVGRRYVVGREARKNRERWKGVCTWYSQCGFCWLPSVCVLEVIYKKIVF